MVEIGPGLSALTRPLLDALGNMTVIELDRDLAARLRHDSRLRVIEADVLRVDFADTDAGGIVYFGRYGRYLERAIIEYRRAVGLPLLGDPGHLFVVRTMSVEYHAPLRFDDDAELQLLPVQLPLLLQSAASARLAARLCSAPLPRPAETGAQMAESAPLA